MSGSSIAPATRVTEARRSDPRAPRQRPDARGARRLPLKRRHGYIQPPITVVVANPRSLLRLPASHDSLAPPRHIGYHRNSWEMPREEAPHDLLHSRRSGPRTASSSTDGLRMVAYGASAWSAGRPRLAHPRRRLD